MNNFHFVRDFKNKVKAFDKKRLIREELRSANRHDCRSYAIVKEKNKTINIERKIIYT